MTTGRKKDSQDVFYNGGRKTHWAVVAFAMIGACMSGVTFVSVPGMVGTSGFGYLQMCIGFFLGYLVIAFVLTPLYFKLDVVSVYQYLDKRFGTGSYRTGAWFFFVSKMLGASVRLFLVCLTLQLLFFGPLGLPFWLNVVCNVAVCFAYTFRRGVKSVIWTDVFKTVCMIAAVVQRDFENVVLRDAVSHKPLMKQFHQEKRLPSAPHPRHDFDHAVLFALR